MRDRKLDDVLTLKSMFRELDAVNELSLDDVDFLMSKAVVQ